MINTYTLKNIIWWFSMIKTFKTFKIENNARAKNIFFWYPSCFYQSFGSTFNFVWKFLNFFESKFFVTISAIFSSVGTKTISINPLSIISRTKWYLILTCFVLSLAFRLFHKKIVPRLSTNILIGNSTSKFKDFKTCWINFVSLAASQCNIFCFCYQ
jgi:hypothetical protein